MWRYFFKNDSLQGYTGLKVGSSVTYIKDEEVPEFKKTLREIFEGNIPEGYECVLSPGGTVIISLGTAPLFGVEPILIYGFNIEGYQDNLDTITAICAEEMLKELRGNESDPELYEKLSRRQAKMEERERRSGDKGIYHRNPKKIQTPDSPNVVIDGNYATETDLRERKLKLREAEISRREIKDAVSRGLRKSNLFLDDYEREREKERNSGLITKYGTVTDLRDGKKYQIDAGRGRYADEDFTPPENYGIFSDGRIVTARDYRVNIMIPFEYARIEH